MCDDEGPIITSELPAAGDPAARCEATAPSAAKASQTDQYSVCFTSKLFITPPAPLDSSSDEDLVLLLLSVHFIDASYRSSSLISYTHVLKFF